MRCGADCKQTGHVVTQKIVLQGNAAFVSNYQKLCLGVVLMLNEALFEMDSEQVKHRDHRGIVTALLATL